MGYISRDEAFTLLKKYNKSLFSYPACAYRSYMGSGTYETI